MVSLWTTFVCYQVIILVPRMNEDIHPCASCWIWSDLVLSALGPSALVPTALGQTRFSTRHRDEYPRSSSSRGWLPMITHENRDEPGNIILFSNAEYHRSSLKSGGWIPYSSLMWRMNIIFILHMRDEYGIHPAKILNCAERGNISILKRNVIPWQRGIHPPKFLNGAERGNISILKRKFIP